MKKLYSTLTILGLIHLVPILQGCPPCNTDELFVSASDVEYQFGDGIRSESSMTSPFNANSLQLHLSLTYPDSVIWAFNSPGSVISAALAMDCDPYYIEIKESIKEFRLGILQENGSIMDLSDQFYASYDGLLYQSIDKYLQNGSIKNAVFHSGWEPQLDSAEFVLTTTLSDERVFQDTVKLFLQ